MKLILTDKTEITVTDDSTYSSLNIIAKTFAELDEIASKITVENLKHAEIGDQKFDNLIPVSLTVTGGINGSEIHAVIVARAQTAEEIMQEQITELQNALAEIAGGAE
jgi:hypothetical protein